MCFYVKIISVERFFAKKGADMTNNEVKNTLKDVSRMVNTMDKEHVTNLLKILIDAQGKKNCASFVYIDIRKTAKKLLNDFIKAEHVNEHLNRKQMKQIFEIMGDYNVYPVCKLCGQPIKICSCAEHDHSQDQSDQMCFSWDHRIPKSKGGGYELANLQPTHKLCNNKRGVKPLYSKHYKIEIEINIAMGIVDDVKSKPSHRVRLRKQDSWCHKQCCQKHR